MLTAWPFRTTIFAVLLFSCAVRAAPLPHVPPGFVVERVAGPPLVEHPMMACFDDKGRLFIAESAGLNLKFDKLREDRPNFIRCLEPADERGHFQKGTIFADKLTFPMGALWHQGALYTAAAPSLWRLRDNKGNGVADKRQELITGFTSTGNAADIHGPFLGPDGWLYWTKGRHAHDIKRPDGGELKGKAARIFRCRPDGTGLEYVCGGGMDDPVEMAFTEEGEAIATVDIFLNKPRRVDALIYCIEGGVYPYATEVLGEFKHTGDLLPPVTDLGWVAPSGLMRYRSIAFGKEYEGNLFSTQFNTHRVMRHILERDGAGFKTKDEDFLVSTDPDFHPTHVMEDADGSLLVIDTGGWFRNGCPTSQVAKPDIKGGIYRVRRKDAAKVDDPRGLKVQWGKLSHAEMAALLDDPRFMVRDRAVERLAQQADHIVPALKQVFFDGGSVRARRNAVWVATRLESHAAQDVIRLGLKDSSPSIQLAAAHAAGLIRDRRTFTLLVALLVGSKEPAVRRTAVLALGRYRDAEAIPSIVGALRDGGDVFLQHAVTYALIEIADPQTIRSASQRFPRATSPAIRRAALLALDQIDPEHVTRKDVARLLDADDPVLDKAALRIIANHPGWAYLTTDWLRKWLERGLKDEAWQAAMRDTLHAILKEEGVQEVVADALHNENTPLSSRLVLLDAIAQAPLDKIPAAWVKELERHLKNPDPAVARQAVATIRTLGLTDLDPALLSMAGDDALSADLRLAALSAAAPHRKELRPAQFKFLLAQLGADNQPLTRLGAASAIGNLRLNDEQLVTLARAVTSASALELPHLFAAFAHSRNADVGKNLVAALEKAPGLSSLSPDVLRKTLNGYPAAVQQAAGPLLKRLDVNTEQQKARLKELEPVLTGGDVNRGGGVFFGKKATCFACHTVKTDGGKIGPDLTKIGSIRTGRDLLEAVVFPSASIVRGYESYRVNTKDGRSFTGLISRETSDSIYLVAADRTEVRVRRSAIETLERSMVSLMPQGLDAQLSREELRDLIAYLMSLR